MNRIYKFILVFMPIFWHVGGKAQNLIQDGTFNASGAPWITSCTLIEAYAFETTYGGTVGTNHVAEVDDESCFHQDVCILPGSSYTFSMNASRRTSGGPNPVTSHIRIDGLNIGGAVVATYVDMDYTRTNTVFSLTPVTGIPTVVVPSGSGVVRLRISLTDNTPGFSTLGIIVDDISLVVATPPSVIGTDTTCPNVPHVFTVSNVGSTDIVYSWSFGAGATPATSTSAAPSVYWSTAGNYVATVSVGNGVCFLDTLSYTIHVTSSVSAARFDTTCSNVAYIFAGSSLTMSGTYNHTFISVGGCDSVITLNLYVKPPLQGNIYDTICAGSAFTYAGHNYTAAGTYLVDTIQNAAGCDSILTLHLSVNPLPPAPIVSSPVYCQYDATVPLSATGSNLLWYGTGITPPYTTAPSVNSAIAAVDTYYVTQSVLGCVSDSARSIVTIIQKPLPPVVRDTAYCQFDTAAILSAIGSDVRWYATATGTAYATSAPLPSTMVPGVFLWYVSQVVNGCESNRATVTVTVASTPIFTINVPHTSICQYDTMSLSYSGVAAIGSYIWSVPFGAAIVGGSVSGPAVTVRFDSAGVYTFSLLVGGPSARCNASQSVTINAVAAPAADVYIRENICLGDTVGLALSSVSNNTVNYIWDFGGAHIVTVASGGGGPYTVTFDTAGVRVIHLTVSTAEGCKSIMTSDTVSVHKLPDAAMHIEDGSHFNCLEDTVLLALDHPDNSMLYTWTPAHFFKSGNSYQAWATVEAPGYVHVVATDPFGCRAADSILFSPQTCCNVYFPSAFTPNGDGKNDLFRPVYMGYHRFHNFRIENRWGQTVFESVNSQLAWDGKFNGVPQDMGVYFYFIKYDCGGETIVVKGDVTLIR